MLAKRLAESLHLVTGIRILALVAPSLACLVHSHPACPLQNLLHLSPSPYPSHKLLYQQLLAVGTPKAIDPFLQKSV